MSNRLLSAQLLITLVVAAVALLLGLIPGLSAFLGGLVGVGANAYFARKVLQDERPRSAGQVLLVVYWAEIVKIAMAAVMIVALCTLFREINVMALVAGFLVVHMGGALFLGHKIPPQVYHRL